MTSSTTLVSAIHPMTLAFLSDYKKTFVNEDLINWTASTATGEKVSVILQKFCMQA